MRNMFDDDWDKFDDYFGKTFWFIVLYTIGATIAFAVFVVFLAVLAWKVLT